MDTAAPTNTIDLSKPVLSALIRKRQEVAGAIEAAHVRFRSDQ